MTKSDNFKYVLKIVQIQRAGPWNVTTIFRLRAPERIRMWDDWRQQSAIFEARFSRCRNVLYFLACRVLESPEQAHDAVENCKITASRNPPSFEYDGAFRSWLVRILIDEALAIVRQRRNNMTKVGTSLDRTQQIR